MNAGLFFAVAIGYLAITIGRLVCGLALKQERKVAASEDVSAASSQADSSNDRYTATLAGTYLEVISLVLLMAGHHSYARSKLPHLLADMRAREWE